MNLRRLNTVLKKLKEEAKLDFAVNRGFCCGTCTVSMLVDIYGDEAIGVFVKWYGKGDKNDLRQNYEYLYIDYYMNEDIFEENKYLIGKILSKYYNLEWDYSMKYAIKISEKEPKYKGVENN